MISLTYKLLRIRNDINAIARGKIAKYWKCCHIEYIVIGEIEVLRLFNKKAFVRVGNLISFFGLKAVKLFGWFK